MIAWYSTSQKYAHSSRSVVFDIVWITHILQDYFDGTVVELSSISEVIDRLPAVPWTIILWRYREGGKAEAVQMRGKPPGS